MTADLEFRLHAKTVENQRLRTDVAQKVRALTSSECNRALIQLELYAPLDRMNPITPMDYPTFANTSQLSQSAGPTALTYSPVEIDEETRNIQSLSHRLLMPLHNNNRPRICWQLLGIFVVIVWSGKTMVTRCCPILQFL